MRPNLVAELWRVGRFGAVGVLNTALGYSVILAGLLLGLGDLISNATGYAAGLGLGFVLNRRFTFSDRRAVSASMIRRYAATFAVAYGANLVILFAARAQGLVDNPLVHLAGIVVYSVIFYIGSARFVFVDRRPAAGTPGSSTS